MNYLLDTHALIWTLEGHSKLSQTARQVIEDRSNTVFVSIINLWEISLKSGIGKLEVKGLKIEEIPELADEMEMNILDLSAADASSIHLLRGDFHKDPFDRMLIWQAIRNGLVMLTCDPFIMKYEKIGLKTIW